MCGGIARTYHTPSNIQSRFETQFRKTVSGNAFVFGAGGLRLKSKAGEIGQC